MIAAIVLGPWAALLTTSVALIIQDFLFRRRGYSEHRGELFQHGHRDGILGLLSLSLLGGNSAITSPRRIIAGAISGYVAINVAALLAAIELGLQPVLFHTAVGQPLYFPYGLGISIPAMLIPHLTLAGIAEGLATALPLIWLQRSNPQLLEQSAAAVVSNAGRSLRWGWAALIGIMVLTPLGLLAPGTAWGEWGRAELAQFGLSSIPAGFDRFADIWSTPPFRL